MWLNFKNSRPIAFVNPIITYMITPFPGFLDLLH